MGFIARAQLASAVCNAGGFGIIETSSGRLDEVRDEMTAMRDRTEKPWGVNIAQMFVADPHIVDFVAEQGVTFVTTSAGDPSRYTDSSTMRASRCSMWSRRCEPPGRPSTWVLMGWWSREAKAADSRARDPCPRWSCCLRSAECSTSRSSPPGVSPTASPWRPPLRWAPRASRWGPAW